MTASHKVDKSEIPAGGLPGSGDYSPLTLQGLRRSLFNDTYHYLVNAPWPVILLFIAGAFGVANVLFALGYMAIGGVANARPGSFSDAFFFSVQTMATIGYGVMTPQSSAANLLVTLQALTGGIGLALMTGLVFAKFSRPTSRVRFSKVAVIGDFQGRKCLMFRMANERDERIIQPQLYVVLLRMESEEGGGFFIRVHDIELVRDRHAFAASDSLRRDHAELVVSLTGIDEGLSQTVHANHTYQAQDIRWDALFVDLIRPREGGGWLMDYSHFDEVHQRG
jgi:inward rectifier potassium channel